MIITRLQLIDWLMANDWRKQSTLTLASICQRLGQSGRGSRSELIERIEHQLDKFAPVARRLDKFTNVAIG